MEISNSYRSPNFDPFPDLKLMLITLNLTLLATTSLHKLSLSKANIKTHYLKRIYDIKLNLMPGNGKTASNFPFKLGQEEFSYKELRE